MFVILNYNIYILCNKMFLYCISCFQHAFICLKFVNINLSIRHLVCEIQNQVIYYHRTCQTDGQSQEAEFSALATIEIYDFRLIQLFRVVKKRILFMFITTIIKLSCVEIFSV